MMPKSEKQKLAEMQSLSHVYSMATSSLAPCNHDELERIFDILSETRNLNLRFADNRHGDKP